MGCPCLLAGRIVFFGNDFYQHVVPNRTEIISKINEPIDNTAQQFLRVSASPRETIPF
jgi:hypothetical protein